MPRAIPSKLLIGAMLLGLLWACTPALNWRELRPDDSGLVALFPCRPDSESRTLVMDGAPMRMTVWVCEAQGNRYALSRLEAGDAQRAAQAERGLHRIAAQTLGLAEPPVPAERPLPGMPAQQGRWLQLSGRAPDGQALQQRLVTFTAQGVVYQATVFGERPVEVGFDGFFGGLAGWRTP